MDHDLQPPTAKMVRQQCRSLGWDLPEGRAKSLARYLELLESWNRRMNLVGPQSWQEMLATLVMDSMHLAGFLDGLPLPGAPLCLDLGAGAGLPGIPLRLVWDRGRYVMVEVRQKRAVFLRHVLARLDIPGTEVFHGAVENLPRALVPADLVLGRAFRPWKDMLRLAGGLQRPGGFTVIMSNDPPPSEKAIPEPWRLVGEQDYRIQGLDRYFWALSL
ncbi:MAG: 16S rRNA (guanine(527)-N(7))-methyltransferase RsmG [Desulfohalobiaceae bacterium]